MPVRFLNRFGVAVLDGRIYLVGGERQEDPDTPRRVWRYEPDCRRLAAGEQSDRGCLTGGSANIENVTNYVPTLYVC